MEIEKPRYFDFDQILWFLDTGYDECLHQVKGRKVSKLVRSNDGFMLFEVQERAHYLQVELLEGSISDLQIAREEVLKWFDMDRPLDPYYERLKSSGYEQYFFDYTGFRLIAIPNLFEALAWSIIGQQINLAFAYKMKRALVTTFGTALEHGDGLFYAFPQPEDLIDVEQGELRRLQFSRQKATYLIGLARLFANGDFSTAHIASMTSTNEMVKALCKIKGVGEWTANYAVMKSIRRPDCIPWGDTGISDAISKILSIDRKPTRDEVTKFYEPMKGWESYLTFYLWRSLSS